MTQLHPLANVIVWLSEQRGVTPVIVTPKYLTLRPIFLVELAKSLHQQVDRSIRIDWYRHVPTGWSLVGDQWARWQAQHINRSLRRAFREDDRQVTLQITASIARPGGVNRELVIGWCDELSLLPAWTRPIQLAGSPSTSRAAA
jgi:hypothetical protein